MDGYQMVALTFVLASVVVVLAAWHRRKKDSTADRRDSFPSSTIERPTVAKTSTKSKAGKGHYHDAGKTGARTDFKHGWLLATLKGHSSDVTDIAISSNSKYMVSTGSDRSLLLWSLKDWHASIHQPSRGTVDLDVGRRVAFAPDCKAVVVATETSNTLHVYKIGKREGGSGHVFSRVEAVDVDSQHKNDIIALGIDAKGHYMMSASGDTTFVLYTIRGTVLRSVDTKQSSIYHACVSPCGRFVATSGFTPDVKVWHVDFDRAGEFKNVAKAFDLTGHNSGIWSFDFSAESKRALTASKDGTFRVYDTDIRFEQGESAHLLYEGAWEKLKTDGSASTVIARFAPDGQSFAISIGMTLRMYTLDEDSVEHKRPLQFEEVVDVHVGRSFAQLQFTPDSEMIVTCADKHIRVFTNVMGLRSLQITLRRQAKRPMNEAHAGRIEKNIAQLEKRIEAVNKQ